MLQRVDVEIRLKNYHIFQFNDNFLVNISYKNTHVTKAYFVDICVYILRSIVNAMFEIIIVKHSKNE